MEHDSNCHVEIFHKPFDEKRVSQVSLANLRIGGMGCHNCAIRVRNALLQLDGVDWVDVDLDTGQAQVAYDASSIAPERFIQAVSAAGNDGRHEYRAFLIG